MQWGKYAVALACVWGAWSWYGTRPVSGVPHGVAAPAEPVQTATGEPAFQFKSMAIKPLAHINLRARVLARKDYHLDAMAAISPTDLALGWGAMSDPSVYEKLSISQGNRFYFYRYSIPPPVPAEQIARSSANMHLIPANSAVKALLKKIRPGQLIQLSGLLIHASSPSGWQWVSSLTREDTGAGACEIIWVEQLTVVTAP